MFSNACALSAVYQNPVYHMECALINMFSNAAQDMCHYDCYELPMANAANGQSVKQMLLANTPAQYKPINYKVYQNAVESPVARRQWPAAFHLCSSRKSEIAQISFVSWPEAPLRSICGCLAQLSPFLFCVLHKSYCLPSGVCATAHWRGVGASQQIEYSPAAAAAPMVSILIIQGIRGSACHTTGVRILCMATT
jgi:hypothetical protein